MEDQQNRDYAFQSYPEKIAIEKLVHEDYEEENAIEASYLAKYIKIWCQWAYENNKISIEHKTFSKKNKECNRSMWI